MDSLNEQEICRIAASVRLTGELLEANGTRALKATEGWGRGPRSASLESSTSDRYEIVHQGTPDEFSARVPSDTVGEAALTPDPYETTRTTLAALIIQADDINLQLRRILYAACPQNTQPASFDPDTPAQISAAGWCISCHRDSGYCEPVAMRPDGTRRYRDFCIWCGEFIATQERLTTAKKKKAKKKTGAPLPPLELVKARHRGDRITQQMVDRALTRKAS